MVCQSFCPVIKFTHKRPKFLHY